MQIKWHNIVGFAFLIVATVLLFRNASAITAFLGSAQQIGPGHTPDQLVVGAVSFTVIVVSVIALIRVTQNRKD